MLRLAVLGLRWADVDLEDAEIRIRQQIGRVDGELRTGPVKTNAGRHELPMLPLAVDMLRIRRQAQAADLDELGQAWQDNGLGAAAAWSGKNGACRSPRLCKLRRPGDRQHRHAHSRPALAPSLHDALRALCTMA